MNDDVTNLAEIHWQAYRYVADEMPADERAQFEIRLDGDQQSREAVAAVVRLTSAVRLLPATDFNARPTIPRVFARAGWVSLGVAATLLVMLATRTGNERFSGTDLVVLPDSQERQVALSWIPVEQEASDAESAPSTEAAEEPEDLETPSWLMAALTAEEAPQPTDSEVN